MKKIAFILAGILASAFLVSSGAQALSERSVSKETVSVFWAASRQVAAIKFPASFWQEMDRQEACLESLRAKLKESDVSDKIFYGMRLYSVFRNVFLVRATATSSLRLRKISKQIRLRAQYLLRHSENRKSKVIAKSLLAHSRFLFVYRDAPRLTPCRADRQILEPTETNFQKVLGPAFAEQNAWMKRHLKERKETFVGFGSLMDNGIPLRKIQVYTDSLAERLFAKKE